MSCCLKTAFTADLESYQTRIRLGDTAPLSTGFMSSLPSGGLHVYKQFNIDPTRPSTGVRTALLQIQKPALLEISVNQNLIARVRVSPGPFNLRDLPLLVGRNRVHVKVLYDFGGNEEFDVDLFFEGTLLGKGIHEFSYLWGSPWINNNREREYQKNSYVSLLHRYGFTERLTAGINAQHYKEQNIFGLELSHFLGGGVVQADIAASDQKNLIGTAERLRFRSADQEDGLLRGLRFFADYEHRSANFTTVNLSKIPTLSPFVTRLEGLVQTQLPASMSLGVGAGYQWGQNQNEDSRLYRASLQNSWSSNIRTDLSYLHASSSQEEGQWLFTLTWADNEGRYSSSLIHDSLSENTSLNFHRNAQKINNDFSADASIQKIKNGYQADLRGEYVASYAEFLLQHQNRNDQIDQINQTKAGLGMGLVWAKGRFSLSRPIRDSFALIKVADMPSEGEIRVNPGSINSEATLSSQESLVLPFLASYQSYGLQIDSTTLPVGYSIEREAYRLRPKYRGGVFVDLGFTKKVLAKGRLIDESGKPIAYASGDIVNTKGQLVTDAFFTDANGVFVIDQLSAEQYQLILKDGVWKKINLPLNTSEMSINLGDVTVQREAGT